MISENDNRGSRESSQSITAVRIGYFLLALPVAAVLMCLWLTWFPPTSGSSFEGASGVGVLLMLPVYYLFTYAIVCLGYLPVRHSAKGLQVMLWAMGCSVLALMVVLAFSV
ncbi:hypothetical protein [Salinicola halimionae]|uniref:hypothetical protein n=1 Tax=Salinicola halimionae TaxID=1949081 RepID=UPI00165FCE84|nr:hypothetical protein [Salinicola halimionae]